MYSPAKTHRRKANNRCLPGCLRCHSKWQRRSRIFGQCSRKQTQIIGRCGCSYTLAVFIVHVTGKTIQVVSDNISTMAYLNHMGGPSHELNQIANAVRAEAINNHVSITCCHIAGKNTTSDRLSRLNDRYEWQLHPELFNFLDTMRGPHTIDRFASVTTVYYSILSAMILWCKRSCPARLDTLHNNFVNAPFRLMPEIQLQLNVQKADGTIIAPKCANMKLW